MMRHIAIGGFSGFTLWVSVIVVVVGAASCDDRDDWGKPIVAQIRATAP